jgi:hypothetical protein
MSPLKNPHQIQVFNGVAQFYKCFIINFVTIMALITKLTRNRGVSKGLGVDQTKVYWNTTIDITKLIGGVSCSYRCIITNCKSYVVS